MSKPRSIVRDQLVGYSPAWEGTHGTTLHDGTGLSDRFFHCYFAIGTIEHKLVRNHEKGANIIMQKSLAERGPPWESGPTSAQRDAGGE